MKEFTVIGLKLRGVDIPIVGFVVLAVVFPLILAFLIGLESRQTAVDVYWGSSLVSFVYMGVWAFKLGGVRSPIWQWCPPFVIARNLETALRYAIMVLLILGTAIAMTVYLVQRVQGQV